MRNKKLLLRDVDATIYTLQFDLAAALDNRNHHKIMVKKAKLQDYINMYNLVAGYNAFQTENARRYEVIERMLNTYVVWYKGGCYYLDDEQHVAVVGADSPAAAIEEVLQELYDHCDGAHEFLKNPGYECEKDIDSDLYAAEDENSLCLAMYYDFEVY